MSAESLPLSVLHIDPQEISRAGVHCFLRERPAYRHIPTDVPDGRVALSIIERVNPDIVVLEMNLPLLNGIEVARELGKMPTSTIPILLCSSISYSEFSLAKESNVRGVVLKDEPLRELEVCLNRVSSGFSHYSTLVFNQKEELSSEAKTLETLLSKTEIAVLSLISEGLSSPEISARLFRSIRTVESHRYNISRKLGIKGGSNLMKYSLELRDAILKIRDRNLNQPIALSTQKPAKK